VLVRREYKALGHGVSVYVKKEVISIECTYREGVGNGVP
jgi:hypothetical protein